jgi:hypothetical protein
MSPHDSVVTDVNPAGWDTPAKIVYINTDTLATREAALLVRYDNDARAGKVIIEAHSPAGAAACDTVAVTPTPNDASNNLQEARLPFRAGVVLGQAGEYLFIITPLAEMRGVWSVGIDFEKE